jgi:sterol desaturase/sphingolipid hydroxylase (fatty acid hydroxylase superfamily)
MAIGGRFLKVAGMAVALTAVGGLLVAERVRPLRKPTRPALPRMVRNGAMGASCQAVIMVAETPLTRAIARTNLRKRRGVQHLLPGRAGKLAAFLVMDYGFYVWHVATHKVPFLWRFHRVHHVDPDLDASTAIRFHFLDMLVSLPWRLVQVRVSGASPATLAAWQAFFIGSILFHHSNWRLPGRWDQRLRRALTTPEMHGIHHSQVPSEMDSNWSSGISWWDYLHGTYRADIPQEAITIGVDDPAAEHDIALLPALAAPLRHTASPDELAAAS